MQLKASKFATRKDLELAVNDQVTEITGTSEDLARLFLSHGQKVKHASVIASDFKAKPIFEKPDRGQRHPYGLNGNLHG